MKTSSSWLSGGVVTEAASQISRTARQQVAVARTSLPGLIDLSIGLLTRAASVIFDWLRRGLEGLIEVERSVMYLLTARPSEISLRLMKAPTGRSHQRGAKVVVRMPRAASPRARRAAA